jgi:hypothetical protein
MSNPLVSVVIPAYNQAEFVGAAIESVLRQTYARVEIIVVDDASPDNTVDVVRQFDDPRVRLISHTENRRLPATRNTGMVASSGDLIAFLDADDFFHAEKLQAHVGFLRDYPEVGVSYNARFELNHSSETIREIWRPPLTVGLEDLMLGFPFAPSDMVVRRDWAFKVGLFNPAMGSAEDTDFPCRLALAGCRFAGIDRALNYRRYHSGRGRKNLPGRLNDVERALEAVFADPRCPQATLALHGTAIKHHLMVIVSLALMQGQTEFGQECVRRLVAIDPSVVDGYPGELLSFLLMESIADETVDHAALLREMLVQLPPELAWLSARYDWAVGQGYLWKGTRAVLWNRPQAGAAHFARAGELCAEIDNPFIGFVTQHLLNYAQEFGAEAAASAIDRLMPHFAQIGGRRSANRLRARYLVNRAFQAYRAGDYTEVPGEVVRGVASDPSYLGNRGLISILVRSLGKFTQRPMAARVHPH